MAFVCTWNRDTETACENDADYELTIRRIDPLTGRERHIIRQYCEWHKEYVEDSTYRKIDAIRQLY
jgi:hypothetical protein